MYKIVGADGKEYGPVSIEQMRHWIAQGRVNAQTRVQAAGSAEWKTAADFPKLGFAPGAGVPGAGSSPPPLPTGQAAGQQKGLAITSLVLGLLSSFLCLGLLTGLPAIICGHIAHNRARRSPGQYGGAGLAIAGFVLGYVGVLFSLLALLVAQALLWPALARAKDKAQRIACVNNMKQIGLSFRTWAIDNDGNFPFNVSTNKGGTLELSLLGSDGFDRNAVFIFQVLSNELSTPKILVCPADTKRRPALTFGSLQPSNVSYLLCSGTNISETNPQLVLAACPIHHNVALCDGRVQGLSKARWEAMLKAGLPLESPPRQ